MITKRWRRTRSRWLAGRLYRWSAPTNRTCSSCTDLPTPTRQQPRAGYPKMKVVCLFVDCLLVWRFSSHSRFFHSYGDVTISGKGLQMLTYAWHSWILRSEGILACYIYCDTGHSMIKWSSPSTRDTHTYCRAFSSGAFTTCLYDLGLSGLGSEHPTFRLRDERSYRLPHRCGRF